MPGRFVSPLLTKVYEADRERAAGTVLTLLAFAAAAGIDVVGCSLRRELVRVAICGGGAAALLACVASLRWHGQHRRVLMIGFSIIFGTLVLLYTWGGLPGAVWAVAILPIGLALFFRERRVLIFCAICGLTAAILPWMVSYGEVPPGGSQALHGLFMLMVAFACTTAGWQARLFTSDVHRHDRVAELHRSAGAESLEELNSRLRFLAERDPLTGVFNRRQFDAELESRLEWLAESDLAGALLVLDLDDFKWINDTYGHPVGDRVITAVAHELQETVDESDLVGRLGGDEFGVFVYGTRAAVRAGTQRILRSVRELEILPTGVPPITLRISAGIADYPGDGTHRVELLRVADTAMYAVKRSGRSEDSPPFDPAAHLPLGDKNPADKSGAFPAF